jgi:hypothetical protein
MSVLQGQLIDNMLTAAAKAVSARRVEDLKVRTMYLRHD